jgi:peptide/nickel transport system permease protein
VPVLIGVTLLTFIIIHLTPGDPVVVVLGFSPNTTPAEIAALRHAYGLDQPLYIQYFLYLNRLLHGNLGVDIYTQIPVSTEILQTFPRTLILAVASLAIAIPIGIAVGIFAAVRQNSIFDNVSTIGSLLAASVPNFWLGLVLILVFGFYLGVAPMSGYGTPAQTVLPALTLGTYVAGGITRFTRSSMLDVTRKEYIMAARSRGLRDRIVIYRHALKNSLVSIITVIGLYFGSLMSGAFFVEVIFAWPGMGQLTYNAITLRNYPVVQGAVLVTALTFILINLVVDILYAFIDPRIQYQSKARVAGG